MTTLAAHASRIGREWSLISIKIALRWGMWEPRGATFQPNAYLYSRPPRHVRRDALHAVLRRQLHIVECHAQALPRRILLEAHRAQRLHVGLTQTPI